MQVSAIGRAVLELREGRRLQAYADSKGVWTIGIGMTVLNGKPVRRGMAITEAECDALFTKTLALYEAAVTSAVTIALAEHEFDALVSLAYNIGIHGFATSTVERRLNAGDRHGAAAAMLLWNKPAAIRTRRQAEHDQFLTPYSVALPRARSNDLHPITLSVTSSMLSELRR